MKPSPAKPKKCKECKTPFTPSRPLQAVCSPVCGLNMAGAKRERDEAKAKAAERKADREKKAKLKSRKQWLDECQAIVNRYVRLRDRDLTCCSCDRPAAWNGQWHASHLRSVGAASAVRFHLWNIHKGCSICNNHLSGNIGDYLPRIRARIGDDKVDWLYTQNQIRSYEIPYLQRLKAVMSKRLRRLERRVNML